LTGRKGKILFKNQGKRDGRTDGPPLLIAAAVSSKLVTAAFFFSADEWEYNSPHHLFSLSFPSSFVEMNFLKKGKKGQSVKRYARPGIFIFFYPSTY
jgi:hypothetical protein